MAFWSLLPPLALHLSWHQGQGLNTKGFATPPCSTAKPIIRLVTSTEGSVDQSRACVAGKSWQARFGPGPDRPEPTVILSGATLGLQTTSMLLACCWRTWPSFLFANQAALTALLCRGQPVLSLSHFSSHCPAVLLTSHSDMAYKYAQLAFQHCFVICQFSRLHCGENYWAHPRQGCSAAVAATFQPTNPLFSCRCCLLRSSSS